GVPSASWPLTINPRSAAVTRSSTDSRSIGLISPTRYAPARICDFISRIYRMSDQSTRIGVDVGGTFTDVIAHDPHGTAPIVKVLSAQPDYDTAVVEAVAVLNRGGVAGVVHGTTVATNAVLERRGARTALVSTAGFRDVLELRRLRIPHMYDPFWRKPEPLVPRRLRFELAERMSAEGEVLAPVRD